MHNLTCKSRSPANVAVNMNLVVLVRICPWHCCSRHEVSCPCKIKLRDSVTSVLFHCGVHQPGDELQLLFRKLSCFATAMPPPTKKQKISQEQWCEMLQNVQLDECAKTSVAQTLVNYSEDLTDCSREDFSFLLRSHLRNDALRDSVALVLFKQLHGQEKESEPCRKRSIFCCAISLGCNLSRFAHRLSPIALVDCLTYWV